MNDPVYLEIPCVVPSANAIWRNANGHVYLSEQYKEFLRVAQYEVCGKRAPKEWPFYDVTVVVYPRRKQGDTDNRVKPTLDVLTKCGYWADDKFVARSTSYFGPCDKNGRTIVIVKGAASKFPFKAGDGTQRMNHTPEHLIAKLKRLYEAFTKDGLTIEEFRDLRDCVEIARRDGVWHEPWNSRFDDDPQDEV